MSEPLSTHSKIVIITPAFIRLQQIKQRFVVNESVPYFLVCLKNLISFVFCA